MAPVNIVASAANSAAATGIAAREVAAIGAGAEATAAVIVEATATVARANIAVAENPAAGASSVNPALAGNSGPVVANHRVLKKSLANRVRRAIWNKRNQFQHNAPDSRRVFFCFEGPSANPRGLGRAGRLAQSMICPRGFSSRAQNSL